jgi:hypothetical protein
MAGGVEERLPSTVRRVSMLSAGAAVLGVFALVAAVSAWRHLAGAAPFPVRTLDTVRHVRSSLVYNLISAPATVLAGAALAMILRRPQWWVKPATWSLTLLAWLTLGWGLAAGPDVPASTDPSQYPIALGLVTSWYPSVGAILTGGVLAALSAISLMMFGDTAQFFYHSKPQAEEDPRWAAVFQKNSSTDKI